MRRLLILSLAMVALLGSCKKDDDDPGITSAEGSWTYTTPDGEVKVDFDIVKEGQSTWSIKNDAITVNGVSGQSALVADGVLPQQSQIGRIRINANDAKLVYDYYVDFINITIADDFKTMRAANAAYKSPDGEHTDLTNVTITRK